MTETLPAQPASPQETGKNSELATIVKEHSQSPEKKQEIVDAINRLWREKYQNDPRVKQLGNLKSPEDLSKLLGPQFQKEFFPETDKPQLNLPPRDPGALSGEKFFEEKLKAKPGDRAVRGVEDSKRDEIILEEVRKGNIDEACRQFTPVTVTGKDGTKITFYIMNRPLTVGSGSDKVVVPASPQLALAMRQHGVAMPTKAMVDAAYQKARSDGKLLTMITENADDKMKGNGAVIDKSRRLNAATQDVDDQTLVIGMGKTKVTSQGAIQHGHEEYGGLKPDGKEVWQNSPAHGGPRGTEGPKYADYSSEFQGVSQEVEITDPSGQTKKVKFEDALADEQYGQILNGAEGKLEAEKYYQNIKKNAGIPQSNF